MTATEPTGSNDARVHLATILGIMAGDNYNRIPPMPDPSSVFTTDDLFAASARNEKQKSIAENTDLGGDPQMAAAKAAYAAGFRGEALVNIIAIAGRESAFNPGAVGDVSLQDGTWGPSVGLFQIRTLKGQTGTGSDRDIQRLSGNAMEQAKAAWSLSKGGTDFGPWKLHGGSFLANTDVAQAQRIAAMIEGGGG